MLESASASKDYAVRLLSTQLGLEKLEFSKQIGYTAYFSDLERSRRTDAQHFQPRFKQLMEQLSGFPTARIRDIRTYNRRDDLLIYTTGAYIGRTNAYLSDVAAMASNHVNILRLRAGIDAAYMALMLQSIIGQFQTQQHARGSAQSELYPADIDRFIVPILDSETQTAIGNLVRASLDKQRESKLLLEQAKARVEQLIEVAAAG